MFDYKYLNRDHLAGFDNYKYMSKDTSPLSVYVMHPFWNKVVEFIPKWVAPNVLTFAGFVLTVFNFVLLCYYDYSYTASSRLDLNVTDVLSSADVPHNVPARLWYCVALLLFVAYTLDGVDGKQARRTQTSGPLGELFDHGLDSYSVFFIPACLYSLFGRADFSVPPIKMYYLMWNLLLNFYLSHWEKYNTGVLFLPWGYDLSMWASIFMFAFTGLKGTNYYKQYVIGSYHVAHFFQLNLYMGGLGVNLPVSLYNVYQSYKLKNGKMRSYSEALRPLWSLLAVFVVSTVWVHMSPTDIINYDPRMVYLLIGTVFSNVACRLIVSQMSDQRCEAINGMLWLLSGGLLISLYLPFLEIVTFYVVTLVAVLAHIHYGTCVVRQMCSHFNINCFVIKSRTD